LAAHGLIEIKAYGKCPSPKQHAIGGTRRQPEAGSEAAAPLLRWASRFSLEIAPEKHAGKQYEYRNHRCRNQNRIDGHSEPPLMSRHYADWLNAIFDADQIVERTFRANKPNLLDADQDRKALIRLLKRILPATKCEE
jgi:hypothetical protein